LHFYLEQVQKIAFVGRIQALCHLGRDIDLEEYRSRGEKMGEENLIEGDGQGEALTIAG
jgi:hypothetical protein